MNLSGTLNPHLFSTQEVADRQALQHLVTAYCHGVDRRDYKLLRTLYHEGATDDHRPYFEGTAQAYIDWLPSMMASWSATSHTLLNMLFIIDGDRAEGEITARAWHRTADEKKDFIACGRYADRYAKRNGIWRFTHRALVLDYSEERTVPAGDNTGAQGVSLARPGADDPVYLHLPLFARDRVRRDQTDVQEK